MQWTALLQLENCIENIGDNLIAKTSDIWVLPIDERSVILCYIFVAYFFF